MVYRQPSHSNMGDGHFTECPPHYWIQIYIYLKQPVWWHNPLLSAFRDTALGHFTQRRLRTQFRCAYRDSRVTKTGLRWPKINYMYSIRHSYSLTAQHIYIYIYIYMHDCTIFFLQLNNVYNELCVLPHYVKLPLPQDSTQRFHFLFFNFSHPVQNILTKAEKSVQIMQ